MRGTVSSEKTFYRLHKKKQKKNKHFGHPLTAFCIQADEQNGHFPIT